MSLCFECCVLSLCDEPITCPTDCDVIQKPHELGVGLLRQRKQCTVESKFHVNYSENLQTHTKFSSETQFAVSVCLFLTPGRSNLEDRNRWSAQKRREKNPEGKRPLGRPRLRWKNDTNRGVKQVGWKVANLMMVHERPVADFCEQVNEYSSSISVFRRL